VLPVTLRAGGAEVRFREGVSVVAGIELRVELREQGAGLRVDWSVRNPGRAEVRLEEIGIGLDAAPELVLEHGWQSWSPVRACRPDDVRPERRDVPEWRRAMYFSDVDRAGRVVTGDQFLLTDAGIAGFLDGRSHLGLVEASPLVAWALLDGVALAAGAERALHPLWLAAGDPGRIYSEYAALWGAESSARATTPAPAGWCSWYQYFSSVTPADVRANLGAASAHDLHVVQIDDGYQSEIGDWLAPRPAWAEGTEAVARDITSAGLRAGIWTAPFLAGENSQLLADHPSWALGRAMHNPVWWGGWALALDTTNPAVLDHITATMAALVAQGFDYHKVDFLYAGALPAADRSCTRAEALRLGLEAVRRGIGDDAFLLGCGSPFGPAVGIVDAMRVSPDVTTAWEPRTPLPGLYEAASSAGNAIATSRLRAPLHRRLWINDNDCLLLRPVQTELDAGHRRRLADSIAAGGAFTFVSDDLSLYGADEWDVLERVRRSRDQPLDLADPFSVHPAS
jgi:alpha-galactosidase